MNLKKKIKRGLELDKVDTWKVFFHLHTCILCIYFHYVITAIFMAYISYYYSDYFQELNLTLS